MVPIDSLETLRSELTTLQESGYVRSSGPLERRGVEVDHAFYEEEAPAWSAPREDEIGDDAAPSRSSRGGDASGLKEELAALQQRVEELESRLSVLESRI
jgi:hypothetical protein